MGSKPPIDFSLIQDLLMISFLSILLGLRIAFAY